MKIKRKKTIIFAIIIIVALGAFFIFRSRKQESPYLTEEVREGTVAKTVSATATLVSQKDLNLNLEISGRIKEIRVKVNDEVARGDVIALIEEDQLAKEVERAKLSYDKAVADAGSSNDTIREAEQAVENAEDYLNEVEDLEDQRVDAARAASQNSKDYYDETKQYYSLSKDRYGENTVECQNAKLTMVNAENSYKAAEEAQKTAEKTKNVNVVTAENSLNTAKENLKTAKSKYARESRDAGVATARTNYEISLNNLEKATLLAPVNGTVTKINFEEGEVITVASTTLPFAQMITSDLILQSNIPESDIADLKTGQKAEVTFDALSLQDKFSAEIIEIEPNSTIIQDVVYYVVKFKMLEFDNRLKPGMSADLDIQVAGKDGVLYIPERAVKREGQKETVRVLTGEDKTQVLEKEIETGLKGDEGFVEVKKGLEKGELVITLEKDSG